MIFFSLFGFSQNILFALEITLFHMLSFSFSHSAPKLQNVNFSLSFYLHFPCYFSCLICIFSLLFPLSLLSLAFISSSFAFRHKTIMLAFILCLSLSLSPGHSLFLYSFLPFLSVIYSFSLSFHVFTSLLNLSPLDI